MGLDRVNRKHAGSLYCLIARAKAQVCAGEGLTTVGIAVPTGTARYMQFEVRG